MLSRALLLTACTPQSPRHQAHPQCSIARLADSATYVLPPDDQWPRILLPAWPPYATAPSAGSLVFVRGSRGVGVSRVVSHEDDHLTVAPTSGPKAGRAVQISRRKAELMRGRDGRPAILLCGDTESFRRLARSQLLPSDRVLEIGCSYGEATALLAVKAEAVIAVDVSSDALERAAARCAALPNVRFEKVDALKQPVRLVDLATSAHVNVLFVDINGNRASEAVAPLLAELSGRLSPEGEMTSDDLSDDL